MENIQIETTNHNLHIEGFPDAIKIFKIDNEKSKRLSDLALHNADLDYCLQCLNKINEVQENDQLIKQTLWEMSIILFFKCFGENESRFSLNFQKIFKNESEAFSAFEYFKNLRNKHIIHDENSYSQALTGAVLNSRNSQNKIAKIITTIIEANTLENDNYSNLYLLIKKTKIWITTQYDELCNSLTKEYENKDFDELYKMDEVKYVVPGLTDLSKKR